jgi:hypothetical protein
MRSSPYILAAVAGLGMIVFSMQRSDAMTITAPAGLRTGAEVLNPVEAVHCRRYKHRHWHDWGYGCRGGVGVIIERSRPGVEIRERRGTTIRSGTKSETGMTKDTSTRSGGTTKSGVDVKAGGSTKMDAAPKKTETPKTETAPKQ